MPSHDESIAETVKDFNVGFNPKLVYPWRMADAFSYSYWYIGFSIPQPIALVLFCLAIFAELLIETTFYVMTSTAALLFEELQTKMKEISVKSNGNQSDFSQLAYQLDQWNKHHDLVCRLVDNIDDCFGLVLLITVGHIFITYSTSFSELVRVPHMFQNNGKCTNVKVLDYCLDLSAFFKISQALMRLLFILLPSHQLKIQVYKT